MKWLENIWQKSKEKADIVIDNEETGKGFIANLEERSFMIKGQTKDFATGENFPVFYHAKVKLLTSKELRG